MSTGLSRWLRDTAIGYCRSTVLVAAAGLVPALTMAVAVFGLSFSRAWSAHLHAPLLVRLVAAIGEWAVAALWVAVAFSVAMTVLGRPPAQLLRRHGGRWLGVEIPSPYRPPRPITRMSTGHWWNGHSYHETATAHCSSDLVAVGCKWPPTCDHARSIGLARVRL